MKNNITVLMLGVCSWGFMDSMARDAAEPLIITAKVVKEKPIWVIDLDATEKLVEFLEKHYVTPGLCYTIDGVTIIDGTTTLWDQITWAQFTLLLQQGAYCKGALQLLASKILQEDSMPVSKESNRKIFDDVIQHYVNAHYTTWPIIKRAVARQCSRYNYLVAE